MPGVLGLDIGGANLKGAHSGGAVRTRPFSLWRDPSRLTNELAALVAELPAADQIAITMTGELCDCFENKRQGVHAILKAAQRAAGDCHVRVWTSKGFVASAAAADAPLTAASANWLALAVFAARSVPRGGVLIDIGSTTSDIVPMASGHPVPRGVTDTERMASSELVYTGARRTPLCAVLNEAVAAEWFATMHDVNLLLGEIAEDASDHETADRRSATRLAAHARLSRMLCADPETCDPAKTLQLAQRARSRQLQQLTAAFDKVVANLSEPADTVVLAGEGEFLARLMLQRHGSFRADRIISFAETYGPDISRAACAYAVAILARKENGR